MRHTHSKSLVKRLALFLSISLALIFVAAWVLVSLKGGSTTQPSGREVAAICLFTLLIGLHGVIIFVQWNAKPCFCPTKSNQQRPLEATVITNPTTTDNHVGTPRELDAVTSEISPPPREERTNSLNSSSTEPTLSDNTETSIL